MGTKNSPSNRLGGMNKRNMLTVNLLNPLAESSQEYSGSLFQNSNNFSKRSGVLANAASAAEASLGVGPSEEILLNMSTKNRDLQLSIGGNIAAA